MTAEPSVDVPERPMSYAEAARILWQIIDSKPEFWGEKIPPLFESRPWALGGFEVPWRLHEEAIDRVVAKGKDGEEVALHELLAVEIAELVVPKLETADLVSAVARALQWRDPTKLEEIKTAVSRKDAPKPRLRGGQSCLFLAVEDADGKELAEVVL